MDTDDIADDDWECDLEIKEEPVSEDENVTNYTANDEIDDNKELILKSVSPNGGYSFFIEESKCEIDFKEEVESECEELPLYDESDYQNFVTVINQRAENEAKLPEDPINVPNVHVVEKDNVQNDRSVVKIPKRPGRHRPHNLFSYAVENPETNKRRRNRRIGNFTALTNVPVAQKQRVECDVCASKFVRKGSLRKHMLTHVSNYTARFPCDLCPLAFVTKFLLDRHLSSHGLRPYACDECAMDFTEKRYLMTHRKIHSLDKPFICGICRRGFKLKSVLKSHLLVHLDEKSRFIASFNCTMCEQSFARRGQLKKHIRAHAYQEYDFALCKRTL